MSKMSDGEFFADLLRQWKELRPELRGRAATELTGAVSGARSVADRYAAIRSDAVDAYRERLLENADALQIAADLLDVLGAEGGYVRHEDHEAEVTLLRAALREAIRTAYWMIQKSAHLGRPVFLPDDRMDRLRACGAIVRGGHADDELLRESAERGLSMIRESIEAQKGGRDDG